MREKLTDSTESRQKSMNTQKQTDGISPSEFFDIRDIDDVKARTGIELCGDDGQPYCCGQRMQIKGGIIGPDYAKCHVCGQEIGDAASPHINGGYIPTKEFLESGKTWVRLSSPNAQMEARTNDD